MTRYRPSLVRSLAATLALSLVAVGPLSAPRVAHAQAHDNDKKLAKQYAAAGVAAQDAGDYDTAITLYQKAYDLIPNPLLLFDIAQAHRLAGHVDDAIAFYQKYLAADPKGAKAQDADDFLAVLQAQQSSEAELAAKAKADADAKAKADADARAKADADAKAKADADAKAKTEADRAAAAAGRAHDDAAHKKVDEETASPTRASTWTTPRIFAAVAAGAGLGCAGAGGYFGLHAKSLSDELSKHGATYDPQKVSDGHTAQRNMYIGYGAGAALIAAGVVLWLSGGPSSSGEGSVALTPTVGDVDGLALGGRF